MSAIELYLIDDTFYIDQFTPHSFRQPEPAFYLIKLSRITSQIRSNLRYIAYKFFSSP